MHDPTTDRLEHAREYARDRAGYLDIRQAVANAAAAYDPELIDPTTRDSRADAVLDAARDRMVASLARRLEDPEYRRLTAGVLVGIVLP